MTRTFLVPLELGTDMDFASVADELTALIEGSEFELSGPVHFYQTDKVLGAPPSLIPPALPL